MSFYIAGPVQNDPNVLKQRALDYIAAYMPAGFTVQPGDPLDLMCEAFALQAADLADVTNSMLDAAFRYFGTLVNVVPIDAVSAQSQVTFTVKDTAGYTVPAGAVVGITDASGTLRGFDLLADTLVLAGSSTGVGAAQAEDPGAVANGLSGTAQVIQAPAFVTGATMAASAGGIDAEADSVYLGRLAETLTLLSPRPVLAPNFAVLARSVAGVYRASAVNLLKPGPPYDVSAEATGQEKNVTVAVTDVAGNTVGSTIRANVATLLQGYREQNFKVWVVDPQYVAIDVTAIVYAWPGWDTSQVHASVIAALTGLLSAANWAADASGNAARWQNDPVIRAGIIQQTIYSVPGVRYTDPEPTFAVHGGSLASTDVTMGAGSAIPALPTTGTLSITVNATS